MPLLKRPGSSLGGPVLKRPAKSTAAALSTPSSGVDTVCGGLSSSTYSHRRVTPGVPIQPPSSDQMPERSADAVMSKIEVSVTMDPHQLKASGFWPELFLQRVLSEKEWTDVISAHYSVPSGQVVRLRKAGTEWCLVLPSMPSYRTVLRKLLAHDVLLHLSTPLPLSEFNETTAAAAEPELVD